MSSYILVSVSIFALSFSMVSYAEPLKITVGPKGGSLTAPSLKQQKITLNKVAGSIGLVDSENHKDRYANNLKDVLQDTAGVIVQPRYGQEVRVSIRGSGIARGFHARGIDLLLDGSPLNLADGSGDYYQIDPLGLRSTEIYKGGNGLFYGASTLGGAINFVTPTAHTATSPHELSIDGGSYSTRRIHGQTSYKSGKIDMLASGTVTRASGYRVHSETDTEIFNGNIGYQISPNIETRFYTNISNANQDLPGALTLSDALNNPKRASVTALSGDQARVTKTERFLNRTSFKTNLGQMDIDTWFAHKDLFHPIFQVIDQDGITYGTGLRYTSEFDLVGHRNELIFGGRYHVGKNKARQFQNIGGQKGQQTLDAVQNADNYEVFLENRFKFIDDVAVVTGVKAFRSNRDYTDKGGLPLNVTAKQDQKFYSGINPKLGLIWSPALNTQHFINVTRSQDVPDFSDLAQTIGTTSAFVPLETQKAWTLEIGSRGGSGAIEWDATIYRSWVRDELLQFTTGAGIPATTFNAGDTIHQGIELGVTYNLSDNLRINQIWNHSDFYFDGDVQYGNNKIAGVPKNLFRTSLTYKNRNGFYITPTLEWVPSGAYADHANTLSVPNYKIIGLKTGVNLDAGLDIYLDSRNLMDKNYISDISTIRDARTTSTAIFQPGEGRSVFAGIKYRF